MSSPIYHDPSSNSFQPSPSQTKVTPTCHHQHNKRGRVPEKGDIFETTFGKVTTTIQHSFSLSKSMNCVEIRPGLMIRYNECIFSLRNHMIISRESHFCASELLPIRFCRMGGEGIRKKGIEEEPRSIQRDGN